MKPTDRVSLGSRGLTISRVGLGTNALGGLFQSVPEKDAVATVCAAYDAGLALFDTAPVYGYGNAERIVGRALAARDRSSVTVTTKVGRILRVDGPPEAEDRMVLFEGEQLYRGTPQVRPYWDFSYEGALRSLEESLQRLGLDRVDAVYVHDPDDHIEEAIHGACRALDRLRDEGVIGAVGVGSNSWQTLVAMGKRARFDCFLIAGRYTLLDQSALDELLPLCESASIALIVGGVYNSGLLCNPEPRRAVNASNKPSAIPTWTQSVTFNYVPATPEWVDRAQRLKDVCDRYDTPLMAAAIQFPLAHPAVASVLMGPRNQTELEENLRMLAFDVPAELWQDLRAVNLLHPAAPVLQR